VKKPERGLPDTNTIVRYLIRDDETQYSKAKEFFDQVRNGSMKAIIIESVIAESVYVLTKVYKVPKTEAAAKLIDVLHYKGIANDDQKELIHALNFFQEHNIDIVDSILCIKAAKPDMSLFSFDRDLNKISASLYKPEGKN